MIHARADYNRIQDPAVNDPSLLSPGSSPIAPDEPVFLLRANDADAPVTVLKWISAAEERGVDPDMVAAARRQVARMVDWQAAHGCKMADAPAGCV